MSGTLGALRAVSLVRYSGTPRAILSVKLQNNFEITKEIVTFAFVRFLHLITIRPLWPKGKTYAPASVGAYFV